MDEKEVEATEAASVEATKIDPEDVKRMGEKEDARNEEAIATEKMKNDDGKLSVAKNKVRPSFFVKKTARHIVKMDVLSSKEDGRVLSVSKSGLGIDFEKDFPFLDHTVLEFHFSIPNYEDMSTYRQRSSVYRSEARQVIVDKLQLRNFILVWHLKDWNVPDDDGNKVELKFDDNGSLSEGSLAFVYALSPTLLDVVMTCFEKDILLV
jgi:hypothetical protein